MSSKIQPGIEVICRSTDCTHNDRPMCNVFTLESPLVIGPEGLCVRYEAKTDTVMPTPVVTTTEYTA